MPGQEVRADMFDCVSLTSSGSCYQLVVPSQVLRESGLLIEEYPDAPLVECELAIESPNVFVEYDAAERTLTYHLPEPPTEPADPTPKPAGLSDGEKAVLSRDSDQ